MINELACKPSAPLLSICIPTFNRAEFLPKLLESVIRGVSELKGIDAWKYVEVVVSDNASTDHTKEVIEEYSNKINIKYSVNKENIGPDLNFLAVIDASEGKFCWLMGSDDIIEPRGLTCVFDAAQKWDVAGFSTNYHRRSFDLENASAVRQPVPYTQDVIVEGNADIYKDFVGHWGFMSCQVVRRDLWQNVCKNKEQFDFLNGYVHIFIMGKMVEMLPKWGYLSEICVAWRGRNDAFLSKDHVDRMMIDVKGYGNITRRLFGEKSTTTDLVINKVIGTHILTHYQVAKVFYYSGKSLRRAALTLTHEYWRYLAFWTKLVPWIILPSPLLHGLWVGYQRTRYRFNPSFKIHPQARHRP